MGNRRQNHAKKADQLDKDLLAIVEQAGEETVMVDYDKITVLDEICVRGRIDPATVRNYTSLYEGGIAMPPLLLLRMERGLVLVDGYHRYHALYSPEARRNASDCFFEDGIPCRIIGLDDESPELTLADARYLHYHFNRAHGLKLNSKECREGRKRYFEAGLYWARRGKVKSLREIGLELGVSHTTVQRFIAKHFKHLKKRWARDYPKVTPFSNNPEGFNGLPRKDKSHAASQEILADIGRIKGKSGLVKPDTQEYLDICKALDQLAEQLRPESSFWHGCAWEFDDEIDPPDDDGDF